ncbi:ChaN family lipoprotein [Desulfovibrio inopinatus]|uniref:ChaN family lipoprotein n=1 Tax=Desulfovibrio inopinatus TaxID=102109 RepID=UPI0006855795|nr:ChaN family lipoprotein [Desulfovibrio inopinatus]
MPHGLRVILMTGLLCVLILLNGQTNANALQLFDIKTQRPVSIETVAPTLAATQIVSVGERHGSRRDHDALQNILSAVLPHKKQLALGLEMFQHESQSELDAYLDGELDDAGLAAVFERDWGQGFSTVLPLLHFCRDNGIPLLGLNIPRDITRKVAARGFSSLDEDELSELPPITCTINPSYEDFLRSMLGDHHHETRSFTFFCEAQRVWDATFAVNALNYLAENPESTVFILCGSVHAWKPAVPSQIQQRAPETTQIIILPDIPPGAVMTTADGDYVLLDSPQGNP